MLKKILVLFITVFLSTNLCFADNIWQNDLRNLFLSNNATILAINIRTFNAQDKNRNGIIDENEESGNFLNAINRLTEISESGINTLHLLPIMAVGKTHALGTAGSLYAPSSFTQINPQLKSKNSTLSLEDQAMKFINEAHKRNMRIILDLPACASYDLYLKHPEVFTKDALGQPVTPKDWTDVRLLDGGNELSINMSTYNMYKDFVDYAIKLGADGIRADAASSKPAKFWKELISYSRTQDPQFMWLAESSDSWTEPISSKAVFTPYNKLLESGFDGFYGSYFKLQNWTKASDLINHAKFTSSLQYNGPKSVIGSFSTHDELSPILINGVAYSNMIMWLNATLPINAYFVDGFSTGDNYIYLYGNKKAPKSETDSNTYFVHRGKIDIFNFSRKPGGPLKPMENGYNSANGLREYLSTLNVNKNFVELKTQNPEVFGFARVYDKTTMIVYGNLNFRKPNNATISIPGYTDEILTIPVKLDNAPTVSKGKFKVQLDPGEIQVFLLDGLKL